MIHLNKIKKIYNKGQQNEFEARHNVSLDVEDGDMLAIIGRSGAGKSTLLHIIGCIDNYDDGEYYFDGQLIKKLKEKKMAKIRNEEIGIVMQEYALVEHFSALENVMLPLDFNGKKMKNRKLLAQEALKTVGMEKFVNNRVNKLSGGQKQRVAIARAIVNKPRLILADEPTGALDSHTANEVMQLFKMLNDTGIAIIIITHDSQVASICKRTVTIDDGRLYSEG